MINKTWGYGSSQVLAKFDFQNHIKKKSDEVVCTYNPTSMVREKGGTWEFVG